MAAAPGVVACSRAAPARQGPVTVFAAASLQQAVDAAAAAHSLAGGGEVRAVYAGSAQLARQIEQGAPADLFVSADLEWMDWLAQRGLVDGSARRLVAGNRLVLVAGPRAEAGAGPGAEAGPLDLSTGPGRVERVLARLDGGRLATAEPEVPAGRYGRQALVALGLWPALESRLAPAENVRAALALVARGEAPLGIVYATDARAEPAVRVVASFPPDSHAPIVYPAAPVRRDGAETAGALRFLDFLSGPGGQAVLREHGFTPPP